MMSAGSLPKVCSQRDISSWEVKYSVVTKLLHRQSKEMMTEWTVREGQDKVNQEAGPGEVQHIAFFIK